MIQQENKIDKYKRNQGTELRKENLNRINIGRVSYNSRIGTKYPKEENVYCKIQHGPIKEVAIRNISQLHSFQQKIGY